MTNQASAEDPYFESEPDWDCEMCPSGATVGGKIDFKQTRRKERAVPLPHLNLR